MNLRRIAWIAIGVWLVGGASSVYAQEPSNWRNTGDMLSLLPYVLAGLFPLGVAMVAVGMSGGARAQRLATSLPLAMAAALLGLPFTWGASDWSCAMPLLPSLWPSGLPSICGLARAGVWSA